MVQGASRKFNSSLPQSVIDRAYERDPASAAAEYGAQFRTDIENFVSLEAVQACVVKGCAERQPQRFLRYVAHTDPSGGSSDSWALSLAHKEGSTVLLDVIREIKPPFSPEAVVAEYAELLHRYRISSVTGDRYAGEFPRELFRNKGIFYQCATQNKSEMFIDLLPLINSRCIDLLDNHTLVSQLVGLERRTSRGGHDSIDHAPHGGHDDVATAVAGCVLAAWKMRANADWLGNEQHPKVILGHASVERRSMNNLGRVVPLHRVANSGGRDG